MSVSDSLGRSASVTTLEDCTFLRMDRRTFLSKYGGGAGQLARNLVGILSRRLRLADTHTRSLAALDVHGRVAAQLLAFAREYGEPLPDWRHPHPPAPHTDRPGCSRGRFEGARQPGACLLLQTGQHRLDKDHRIIVRDEESLARRAR